jgi:hypothetical protein
MAGRPAYPPNKRGGHKVWARTPKLICPTPLLGGLKQNGPPTLPPLVRLSISLLNVNKCRILDSNSLHHLSSDHHRPPLQLSLTTTNNYSITTKHYGRLRPTLTPIYFHLLRSSVCRLLLPLPTTTKPLQLQQPPNNRRMTLQPYPTTTLPVTFDHCSHMFVDHHPSIHLWLPL